MRSRKTEIYGGLRGCIQKVIHFMHKVIPRYPVESPVDKVDSRVPHPAAEGKRVDTCGFYPLDSRFPLFVSLAKIGERRPLRKGERQRILSSAWTRVARHVSTYSQGRIPCCYTYGFICAGAAQGELPEGQERVPWGITVPRNPLAGYNARHLRVTLINRLYRRVRRPRRTVFNEKHLVNVCGY